MNYRENTFSFSSIVTCRHTDRRVAKLTDAFLRLSAVNAHKKERKENIKLSCNMLIGLMHFWLVLNHTRHGLIFCAIFCVSAFLSKTDTKLRSLGISIQANFPVQLQRTYIDGLYVSQTQCWKCTTLYLLTVMFALYSKSYQCWI